MVCFTVMVLISALFLLIRSLINLVTHFMMVKGIELHPFQIERIDWGAVTVFIAVLLIVLFITLADPVIRLIRLELRYLGKQQEKILEAKKEPLVAIDREIPDDQSLRASIGAELASLQGVAHLSELLRIARRLNVFTGRRYKERAGEWSSDALRLSPTKSFPPCSFICA